MNIERFKTDKEKPLKKRKRHEVEEAIEENPEKAQSAK